MSYLLNWLYQAAAWFVTLIANFFLHVLTLLLQGLEALIAWIPAPSFFQNAAGWIGSIPPLLADFLSALQIGAGITIVVSALTLRFLIRRIPFIG
jgi:hypothetical protein